MNKRRSLKPIPDSRQHRRVAVGLEGALRIPRFGVEIIKTTNISEGGVCVVTTDACPVSTGETVQLHLSGIISSSSDNDRLNTYNMRVVHVNARIIGLEFT